MYLSGDMFAHISECQLHMQSQVQCVCSHKKLIFMIILHYCIYIYNCINVYLLALSIGCAYIWLLSINFVSKCMNVLITNKYIHANKPILGSIQVEKSVLHAAYWWISLLLTVSLKILIVINKIKYQLTVDPFFICITV